MAVWTKTRSHNTLTLASSKTIRFGFNRFGLGLGMKFMTGLLAMVLLLAGVSASQAVVRIGEDRGGRIGTYLDKYEALRSSGQSVIIDGLCASACTIVPGTGPSRQDLRDVARDAWVPCGLGFRRQRPRGHKP